MRCQKKQISVLWISIVLGSLGTLDLNAASAAPSRQFTTGEMTHRASKPRYAMRPKQALDHHAIDDSPTHHLTTCSPCTAHSDCQIQSKEARCLSYGDHGSFCGASCSRDEDCPSERFSCLALSDSKSQRLIRQCVVKPVLVGQVSGPCTSQEQCSDGHQCVSGLCGRWRPGRCACSTWATRAAIRTTCHRVNAFGRCAGTRFCDTDGLTECSAPAPRPERCDNIDNDCDGQTDEDLTSACTFDTGGNASSLMACTHDQDCVLADESCDLTTKRCQARRVTRQGIQSCNAGVWTCRALTSHRGVKDERPINPSNTPRVDSDHSDSHNSSDQQAPRHSYAKSSISFVTIEDAEPQTRRDDEVNQINADEPLQKIPTPRFLRATNPERHRGESFSWVRSGPAGEGSLLLASNGRVWTRHYGWLDERFQAKGHYAKANQRCPSGQFVRGFTAEGEQICAPVSAGAFALSDQRCPAGSFQRGVSAAGTPLCTSKLLADLDADGHRLTNVAKPLLPGDAANKAYVDERISEIAASASGARVFTGVIALRSGDCPRGWTTDSVERLKGRDGKVYVALSRNGLYLGGLNTWGHGDQRLTVNFRQESGPTKVCSRQFHSTSGNPHVAMIFSANGQCPSGYVRWSTKEHLRGKNGWAYAVTSGAGFYLGYVDSWSANDQSGPELPSYSRRWFQADQAAAACIKVMGVDEEPDKKAGVFAVFVGVKGPRFCPRGWLYQSTAGLCSPDGKLHIQANRHASMIGALYGRDHGGNAYQSVRLSDAHAQGICSRYVEVHGQPFATVRTPNQGDCPSEFTSFQAHAIKGDDGVGYAQMAAKALYIGGLDQWQRNDKDAGYWNMTLSSAVTHKLCLAVDDK